MFEGGIGEVVTAEGQSEGLQSSQLEVSCWGPDTPSPQPEGTGRADCRETHQGTPSMTFSKGNEMQNSQNGDSSIKARSVIITITVALCHWNRPNPGTLHEKIHPGKLMTLLPSATHVSTMSDE